MVAVEVEYYELLGVPTDVNDTDLKRAYRKTAVKYHPDKNPDPNAEEKFKEIRFSKAYQILSDPNLRAIYDRNGKSMTDSEGPTLEDPLSFFANVFGGARFEDYIGELLLKEVFKAASAAVPSDSAHTVEELVTSDEEAVSHTEGQSRPKLERFFTAPEYPIPQCPIEVSEGQIVSPRPFSSRSSPFQSALTGQASHMDWLFTERRKLTSEQKRKKESYKKEQTLELKKRVKILSEKLIGRMRPIISAEHPSDPDDPGTVAFREMIEQEVRDLKLENFGIELLRTIGAVYISEASSFIKSRKTFNISGLLNRVKDKKDTAKLIWGMFGNINDTRHFVEDAEKLQASGDVQEEDLLALEHDVTGRVMLMAWKVTRFEVVRVVRAVCNLVLKDKTVSENILINRAKALIIIGQIFMSAEPDESTEERREVERLVTEAASGKSEYYQLKAKRRSKVRSTRRIDYYRPKKKE